MRSDYRKLLTQAYDIDKPDAPSDELAYYQAFAVAADGPVLEAMCGSGRFLVPMLASGLDVDGVDSSEDMLRACEEKCEALGLTARLSAQDLQRLELERRYALVFCAGGSWGLLPEMAEAQEALRRVYDHLLPGGTFVLEIESPKSTARGGLWGGRFWRRPDGAVIALRGILRAVSEELEEGLGVYELYVDGKLVETEMNEWARRFWTPGAVTDALGAAGFVDVVVTAPFSDAAPEDGASMHSVVARRPA